MIRTARMGGMATATAAAQPSGPPNDGVTGDLVRAGGFEIVVAGERFPARASLSSMYDPKNERVRM